MKDNYNIPSNNRELQLVPLTVLVGDNYNIPSNNRELQPTFQRSRMLKIITYQVITGNYSKIRESFNINPL